MMDCSLSLACNLFPSKAKLVRPYNDAASQSTTDRNRDCRLVAQGLVDHAVALSELQQLQIQCIDFIAALIFVRSAMRD
jgi:adenylosuccinate synthase